MLSQTNGSQLSLRFDRCCRLHSLWNISEKNPKNFPGYRFLPLRLSQENKASCKKVPFMEIFTHYSKISESDNKEKRTKQTVASLVVAMWCPLHRDFHEHVSLSFLVNKNRCSEQFSCPRSSTSNSTCWKKKLSTQTDIGPSSPYAPPTHILTPWLFYSH